MEIQTFEIPGLVLVKPKVFGDERGFFMETYHRDLFREAGIEVDFIQANHSRSSKGVLRGLHFQKPPHAQDKLVRVVRGAVLDVAVDLRVGSPTYGRSQIVELSDTNHCLFFVPKGFAHGFLTISEIADFEYMVTDYYAPASEGGILWGDPGLKIDWVSSGLDIASFVINDRDRSWPRLCDTASPFRYE